MKWTAKNLCEGCLLMSARAQPPNPTNNHDAKQQLSRPAFPTPTPPEHHLRLHLSPALHRLSCSLPPRRRLRSLFYCRVHRRRLRQTVLAVGAVDARLRGHCHQCQTQVSHEGQDEVGRWIFVCRWVAFRCCWLMRTPAFDRTFLYALAVTMKRRPAAMMVSVCFKQCRLTRVRLKTHISHLSFHRLYSIHIVLHNSLDRKKQMFGVHWPSTILSYFMTMMWVRTIQNVEFIHFSVLK